MNHWNYYFIHLFCLFSLYPLYILLSRRVEYSYKYFLSRISGVWLSDDVNTNPVRHSQLKFTFIPKYTTNTCSFITSSLSSLLYKYKVDCHERMHIIFIAWLSRKRPISRRRVYSFFFSLPITLIHFRRATLQIHFLHFLFLFDQPTIWTCSSQKWPFPLEQPWVLFHSYATPSPFIASLFPGQTYTTLCLPSYSFEKPELKSPLLVWRCRYISHRPLPLLLNHVLIPFQVYSASELISTSTAVLTLFNKSLRTPSNRKVLLIRRSL